MRAEQSASSGTIRILRAGTYFGALLVAATAALLAIVDSYDPAPARIAFAAFGLVVAAVMVLWVHQPIPRMSVTSAILLVLAFIAPNTLVRGTFNSALCRGSSTPCTPTPNSHLGLRLGLAGVLLLTALAVAAVGLLRTSRLDHTPHPRRRSLA